MTQFPTLVYICPGQHQRSGGTYGYKAAKNQSELDSLIEQGYFMSLMEAIEGKSAAEAAAQVVEDNEPPTREELETKARELGLKFDGRTSDAKLGRMIADELGA